MWLIHVFCHFSKSLLTVHHSVGPICLFIGSVLLSEAVASLNLLLLSSISSSWTFCVITGLEKEASEWMCFYNAVDAAECRRTGFTWEISVLMMLLYFCPWPRETISAKNCRLSSISPRTTKEKRLSMSHWGGGGSFQQDYLYLPETCLSPPCLRCDLGLKPQVCLLLHLLT